jgi:Fe2+ or Zn2+ uptake regulation protein
MLYLLTSTTASGHLVCRDCHTVTPLDPDTTTALTSRLHDAHGFTPDPGHLSITGRCATCSTNNTVPRSPV